MRATSLRVLDANTKGNIKRGITIIQTEHVRRRFSYDPRQSSYSRRSAHFNYSYPGSTVGVSGRWKQLRAVCDSLVNCPHVRSVETSRPKLGRAGQTRL